MAEHPVMILAGRVHTYEGWDLSDVVFAVRTAVLSGCSRIALTNAAGGVGEGLEPGDLVLIRDHINLTGRNPLTGLNDPRLGPRFPDMSEVYPAPIRSRAVAIGERVGVPLKEGVYAWFLGPSYETPAEVQMAKRLGADLVGMSTVPEAIAARHMGAAVLGISLVTNLAAGISKTPLSHEEVTATAEAARERFTRLLDALLPALVAGG
jgi:purine-nucleoside phosphorylase